MQQQPVEVAEAAGVLDRDQPGLRQRSPRLGAVGDRQGEGATGELGVVGRVRAAVAVARALVDLAGQGRGDLAVELTAERAARERLAAAVEDERGAADE